MEQTEKIMGAVMGLKDRLSKKTTAIAKRESQEVSVSPTPEMLIKQALDKGVPIETMEKFMIMRKEFREEQAKDAFMRDLAGFQGECPVIKKTKVVMNKDGKTVRYHYAPLDHIVEQISPYLSKWGFSYTIQTVNEKDPPAILSILTAHHIGGHSRTTEFRCPIGSTDYMTMQQAYASASTFSKRYCLQNGFGVITGDEDDDAQSGDVPKVEEPAKPVVKSAKYKADEKQIFRDVKNKRFTGTIMADGSKVDLTGVRAQVLEMLKKKVYSDKKIVDIRERVARFLMIAEDAEKKMKEPVAGVEPGQSKEIVVEKPEVVKEEVEHPSKSVEYLEIEARIIKDIAHKAFVGKVMFAKKAGEKKDEIDLGKYRRELPNNLAKNMIPIEKLRKKADVIAMLLQASLDKIAPQDTPGHEKFTPPEGFVAHQEEEGGEGTDTLFADLGEVEVDITREGNLAEGE